MMMMNLNQTPTSLFLVTALLFGAARAGDGWDTITNNDDGCSYCCALDVFTGKTCIMQDEDRRACYDSNYQNTHTCCCHSGECAVCDDKTEICSEGGCEPIHTATTTLGSRILQTQNIFNGTNTAAGGSASNVSSPGNSGGQGGNSGGQGQGGAPSNGTNIFDPTPSPGQGQGGQGGNSQGQGQGQGQGNGTAASPSTDGTNTTMDPPTTAPPEIFEVPDPLGDIFEIGDLSNGTDATMNLTSNMTEPPEIDIIIVDTFPPTMNSTDATTAVPEDEDSSATSSPTISPPTNASATVTTSTPFPMNGTTAGPGTANATTAPAIDNSTAEAPNNITTTEADFPTNDTTTASPATAEPTAPGTQDMVYFTIEYQFEQGVVRDPTQEEVQEVICKTNLFFRDRMRNHTGDGTIQSEATNIDWAYLPEALLPFKLSFTANVTANDYQNTVPLQTVLDGMAVSTTEIEHYVEFYVWTVSEESLFLMTDAANFTDEVNLAIPVGQLPTYTCPTTTATTENPTITSIPKNETNATNAPATVSPTTIGVPINTTIAPSTNMTSAPTLAPLGPLPTNDTQNVTGIDASSFVDETVWDILQQDPETQWFVQAWVELDHLDDVLRNTQTSVTVFVPPAVDPELAVTNNTDDSGAPGVQDDAPTATPVLASNKPVLSNSALENHIFPGYKWTIADLQTMDGQIITSLNGNEWVVDVLADDVFLSSVGNSNAVVEVSLDISDQMARNGVIHRIDAPLLLSTTATPPSPSNTTLPNNATLAPLPSSNTTSMPTSSPSAASTPNATTTSSMEPMPPNATDTSSSAPSTNASETGTDSLPPESSETTTPIVQINTSFMVFNTEGIKADALSSEDRESIDRAFATFVEELVSNVEEKRSTTPARYLRARRKLAVTLDGTRIGNIQDTECQTNSSIPSNATCQEVDGQYDLIVVNETQDMANISNTYEQATNVAIAEGKLQESLEQEAPNSSFSIAGPVVTDDAPTPTPVPTSFVPTLAPTPAATNATVPPSSKSSEELEWWMILLFCVTGVNFIGCIFFAAAFFWLSNSVKSLANDEREPFNKKDSEVESDTEGRGTGESDQDPFMGSAPPDTSYNETPLDPSQQSQQAGSNRILSSRLSSRNNVASPEPQNDDDGSEFDSESDDEFEDEPLQLAESVCSVQQSYLQPSGSALEEENGTDETDDDDRSHSSSDSGEVREDEESRGEEDVPLVSAKKESDENPNADVGNVEELVDDLDTSPNEEGNAEKEDACSSSSGSVEEWSDEEQGGMGGKEEDRYSESDASGEEWEDEQPRKDDPPLVVSGGNMADGGEEEPNQSLEGLDEGPEAETGDEDEPTMEDPDQSLDSLDEGYEDENGDENESEEDDGSLEEFEDEERMEEEQEDENGDEDEPASDDSLEECEEEGQPEGSPNGNDVSTRVSDDETGHDQEQDEDTINDNEDEAEQEANDIRGENEPVQEAHETEKAQEEPARETEEAQEPSQSNEALDDENSEALTGEEGSPKDDKQSLDDSLDEFEDEQQKE